MSSKAREQLSNKDGSRSTVYWIERNSKYADYEREGKIVGSRNPGKFATGNSYTGDWKNNKKHGFGTQNWKNGNMYQGHWENNLRDGNGTLFVKRNGQHVKSYSGAWKNDKRHGEGIHYAEDGTVYTGNWVNGKKHGDGLEEYPNGDTYQGEFQDGVRCGYGTLELDNGDCYQGHFQDDLKHGSGKYFYTETRKVYTGEWIKGVPRCGEYSDWPQDMPRIEGSSREIAIPAIELADPQTALCDAFASIGVNGAKRSARSTAKHESTFSHDETDVISDAFDSIDTDHKGYIRGSELVLVLNELSIFPTSEDIQYLLDQLHATDDSKITIRDLLQVLSALRVEDDN